MTVTLELVPRIVNTWSHRSRYFTPILWIDNRKFLRSVENNKETGIERSLKGYVMLHFRSGTGSLGIHQIDNEQINVKYAKRGNEKVELDLH